MKANIIITVKSREENTDNSFNYDMEIPLETTFEILSYDILELIYQIKKNINYGSLKGDIYCERFQRFVGKNETPASIGLLNGDILIIS